MNKFFYGAAAFMLMMGSESFAKGIRQNGKDSLSTVKLKTVEIVSTRADKKTPVAFTDVSKEQIERMNTGVDVPLLLNMTPSLVTTSDAGMGIGYTTLRIRGVDASRINITTNGIPMNDPEEQSFFWVDAPDIASSLRSIQIQRGAGTSTNGAASFGATVNMITDAQPTQPHAEVNASYGSYNTEKETVSFGTGMLGKFAFDARLSNISTDGYIFRGNVKLNSYFVQGGYYDGDTFLKFIIFEGKEKTYHAWNYDWQPGMNRRYNSCGYMYTDENGKDHFYNDQTDNYLQTNYQLLFHHRFNNIWNLNAALHATDGHGYYDEYISNADLATYEMGQFAGTSANSDLTRQTHMKNFLGGGVFSLDYHKDKLNATFGGGLSRFCGHYYGLVDWIKDVNGTSSLEPAYEYFRNRGFKVDGNLYLKANYEFLKGFNAYADLQYRHIHHSIVGPNNAYDYTTQALQRLDIHKNFNFWNPKAGISWQINPNHRAYASFGIAQREPTRNCYTNSVDQNGVPLPSLDPKSEKFFDYELGYQFQKGIWQAGFNLYYMDYTDQLVQNGQLNYIGEPVYINVPNSYRCGIEFQAALKPVKWFDWEINATLSRNRIKNYTQENSILDENWEALGTTETYFKSTAIAFSPTFILNNGFNFHYSGFNAQLQSHIVSRQYLTNTQEKALSIYPYFVSDLNLNYTFKTPLVKSITVGCTLYNLFNEEYESNGWGSCSYLSSTGSTAASDLTYTPSYGLSAQAGFHIMGNIIVKF